MSEVVRKIPDPTTAPIVSSVESRVVNRRSRPVVGSKLFSRRLRLP